MLCVLPGGATLAWAYCDRGNVLILLQSVGRVSAAPPGKKSGDMIAGLSERVLWPLKEGWGAGR